MYPPHVLFHRPSNAKVNKMPTAYINSYSPRGASRLLPSRANRAEPLPNLAPFILCKSLYRNLLTPKTKPPQKYRETVKSSLLCAARITQATVIRKRRPRETSPRANRPTPDCAPRCMCREPPAPLRHRRGRFEPGVCEAVQRLDSPGLSPIALPRVATRPSRRAG